jgi:hypothetical protein
MQSIFMIYFMFVMFEWFDDTLQKIYLFDIFKQIDLILLNL